MEGADANAPSDRGVFVASILLLGVATAAGFGRVFAGLAPTIKLAGVAVVAIGVAAIFRRNLVLSLGVSVVALALFTGLLVYPGTLVYGFPGPRTLDAVVRALGKLGEDAVREVAPAPALRSLMTASLFAVWAAATAAQTLAVRARSPILALLPGAVLLAFAGVVTEGGARPVYAVLYLVASIGVLFGASIDRLGLWGPVVEGRAGRRHVGGATGRWARRLGAAAVVVAMAVPGALPGYGSSPLLQIEPDGASRVSINPIVDIRPSLMQQDPAELFVVEAERASYWRLLSLDRFDGRTWSSSDPLGEQGTVVTGEASFESIPLGGRELEQTIEIRALSVPWLPAAHRIDGVSLTVDGDGGAARWDAEGSFLAVQDRTEEGDRYTVRSSLFEPSPEELDRAWENQAPQTYAEYLEVPADLPPELIRIARRVTRGARTPYRQALALQSYLKSFDYDLFAPAGHGVNDILFFLTESQRGYCEQFAGTMAVLLRLLQIPSRVAVGFTPGTTGEDRLWHVTTQDAHAWVEAYFPGHGWLAFEPTPSRANPVAQSYLAPPFTEAPRGTFVLPRERGAGGAPNPGRAAQQDNERAQGGALGAARRPESEAEPARRWPFGAIVLPLLVAAAVVFAAGRELARRLALARAGAGRDRVITAYRVFEASAADVGSGRRRGETVAEYRRRIGPHLRHGERLDRLAALSMRAAYSAHQPTAEEGREAVSLCRALVRDVRRGAGVARAALGAIRPAPPV